MSGFEIAGAAGVVMTAFNLLYDLAMAHHSVGVTGQMGDGLLRIRLAMGCFRFYDETFGLACVQYERMPHGRRRDMARETLVSVLDMLDRIQRQMNEIRTIYEKHAVIESKQLEPAQDLKKRDEVIKDLDAFVSVNERTQADRLEEQILKNLDAIQRWHDTFRSSVSSDELKELSEALERKEAVVDDLYKCAVSPDPTDPVAKIEFTIKHLGRRPPEMKPEVEQSPAPDPKPDPKRESKFRSYGKKALSVMKDRVYGPVLH